MTPKAPKPAKTTKAPKPKTAAEQHAFDAGKKVGRDEVIDAIALVGSIVFKAVAQGIGGVAKDAVKEPKHLPGCDTSYYGKSCRPGCPMLSSKAKSCSDCLISLTGAGVRCHRCRGEPRPV